MTKKYIVRIIAILTIFSIMLTAGCNKQVQGRYSADFLVLFNTATRIIGYADSEEEFEKQSAFIHERLNFYHQQYNRFAPVEGIQNLYTINQQAGIAPVKVDASILDLLELSKQAYVDTDGTVNVMMGSVTSLWHEYRERYVDDEENSKLPPESELQEAASHMDMESLVIDRENSTVYISDPKAKLDVGAIAKGYAVQRVADEAREYGITNMLISVGGNVVAIDTKFDSKGKKEKWSVGIQNPDTSSNEEVSPSLKLKDMSLVSSGDYERYYVHDGKMYAHIIDPKTLFPPTQFKQVTVAAEDSGFADISSTALFIMTLEEGKEFAKKHGIEALWILNDGTIEYSEGFRSYEK